MSKAPSNKKKDAPDQAESRAHPQAAADIDKSLAQILAFPGKATRVSLELPLSTNQPQWHDVGIALCRLDEAKQWWFGDWWAFGEHKYGDRRAIVEDDDWTGPPFGTCANYASVCRVFETSRRRELISFSHHQLLASRRLKPELVDELLDWCETPLKTEGKRPHSVHELKEEINRRLNRDLYDQIVRDLDNRIQQRCKNLSKAKANEFKDEILKQAGNLLYDRHRKGNELLLVDLEMVVEKTMNDLLGALVSGDPILFKKFSNLIREWEFFNAKELDEIVAAAPIEQARDHLDYCQSVLGQLEAFIAKLEARITKLEAKGIEVPLGVAATTAEEWIQNRNDRGDRALRAAVEHRLLSE